MSERRKLAAILATDVVGQLTRRRERKSHIGAASAVCQALRCADELTPPHAQASRRAERKIDPRAHAARNPVGTAIVDPDRASLPVQRIRGRNRCAESVIVRCRS